MIVSYCFSKNLTIRRDFSHGAMYHSSDKALSRCIWTAQAWKVEMALAHDRENQTSRERAVHDFRGVRPKR